MRKNEPERIFDDLARMAGGAVNLLGGIRQQVRDDVRARVEELAARMDLVPREDFDRACARLAALEDRLAALEKGRGKGAKSVRKSPAKKTAKKKRK